MLLQDQFWVAGSVLRTDCPLLVLKQAKNRVRTSGSVQSLVSQHPAGLVICDPWCSSTCRESSCLCWVSAWSCSLVPFWTYCWTVGFLQLIQGLKPEWGSLSPTLIRDATTPPPVHVNSCTPALQFTVAEAQLVSALCHMERHNVFS